jgi:hypothetical protein
VAFRLGHDHPVQLQQDDLIQLVSALLAGMPGDAVLMYGDTAEAWLLRRGGELSVSENVDIWPANRLALLPRPYRRASYSLTT